MDVEKYNISLPENLTLADDFLFGKIFQDPKLCLKLIKIILPELNIQRVIVHERQKSIKTTFDSRGVRFDVYVHDDQDRIINVEMQTVKRDNIMKRTRAYHSMIDLDTMRSEGFKKYDDMPEVIVIFICCFDLFGLGRHIYTFRNICEQSRDLFLNDGARTIFLNTKGKDEDISQELKAFLNLVEGQSSDDLFVKELEKTMQEAKFTIGDFQTYLMTKVERELDREEGREEGRAEERARSEARFKTLVETFSDALKDFGVNAEIISDCLKKAEASIAKE